MEWAPSPEYYLEYDDESPVNLLDEDEDGRDSWDDISNAEEWKDEE